MGKMEIYLTDLIESPKDIKKIAKKLATIYRKFPEYNIWSSYKANSKSECEICGISLKRHDVKVNVHHEPTLTEVIIDIIEKKIDEKDYFTTIDVLKEVHDKHLNNEITYMVLCECCHRRLHQSRK